MLSANSETMTRLSGYILTAGAAGLAAGSAGAAVTIFNVNSTVTANNQTSSQAIDVDGDSKPDILISAYDNPPSYGYIYINPDYSQVSPSSAQFHVNFRAGCTASNVYAGNVAQGTTINASLFSVETNFSTIWSMNRIADCNNLIAGEWSRIAFRFDPAGGTNWRYGYLDVRPRVGSTIVDIGSGAYESTPGISLLSTAPATTAVPVGPAVPIGIGLLIAGAAALRYRRQKQLH